MAPLSSARTALLLSLIALGACDERRPPSPAPLPEPTGVNPNPGLALGMVEGRVRLTGDWAPARVKLPASVARQCGVEIEDGSLRVSAERGLAQVVVALDAPGSPAEPTASLVVVDQRRCAYEPFVAAARAGGVIELRNSDPLMHNVRADLSGNGVFNVGMPLEGMVLRKKLPDEPGVVELHCDVHPWMRASVRTFPHSLFATTDADGRFLLRGIPAGNQKVIFWHPRLGERVLPVEVPVGGTARVDLEWERPSEAK